MFADSPYVHVAGTTEQGEPVLRVLHGVVVDQRLCFHAADIGEKTSMLGRPAVAMTQKIVAEVPSYATDPERACPATTYYRSAQTSGVLRRIDDVQTKAAVMQALMGRYQPEGGHAPITADDPRYRAPLKSLLVVALPLADAVAKVKLGQNRRPAQLVAVLEALWRRGGVDDVTAIAAIVDAHPDLPTPSFLASPQGTTLSVDPPSAAALPAAQLLRARNLTCDALGPLAAAHRGSEAWVVAHDADGTLVGTVRAIGDRVAMAHIIDLAVHAAWAERGLAAALVRLLLDHPSIRDVPNPTLGSRAIVDAASQRRLTARGATTAATTAATKAP